MEDRIRNIIFDRVIKAVDKALVPEEEEPKPSYYGCHIECIDRQLARLEEIEHQAQPLPEETRPEKPSELVVAQREAIEPNSAATNDKVAPLPAQTVSLIHDSLFSPSSPAQSNQFPISSPLILPIP